MTNIRAVILSCSGVMQKVLTGLLFLILLNSQLALAQTGADNSAVTPKSAIGGRLCPPGSPLYVIPDSECEVKGGEISECVTCAECGDGYLYEDSPLFEQCDGDVYAEEFDAYPIKACAADCKVKICGDGKLDTEAPLYEECDGQNFADDAIQIQPRSCSNDCKVEYCGDGIIQGNLSEQCEEDQPVGVNCKPNCRLAGCGDGYIEDPETCDPFIPNGQTGYQLDCRPVGHTAQCTFCGDNKIQANEACDGTAKGAVSDADAVCKADCSGFNPYCGDGIANNGERCDGEDFGTLGKPIATSVCSELCQIDPVCGDGIANNGERCDGSDFGTLGKPHASATCSAACQINPYCGDGVVNNGERCDGSDFGALGKPKTTATCSSSCQINPYCGDNVVQSGEQCELPNTSRTLGRGCNGSCQNTCASDGCGRPCGHSDWGKACRVIKCESIPYLPNCNTYRGDGSRSCWNKRGSCSNFQLEEWCTRRVRGNNWDALHRSWVDNQCSGNVVLNGKTYSCFNPSNYTIYSCTTPLVLNFDLETPVKYINDDGKTQFNLAAKNEPAQVRTDWPTAVTPWLALDNDGDGLITSGSELFGTATSIGIGDESANFGFEALAQLDLNHDEKIDAADPYFAKLLLWSDANSDRISDKSELQTLAERGIKSISLKFKLKTHCDERGNCENERAEFIWVDKDGKEHKGEVVDINLLSQDIIPQP